LDLKLKLLSLESPIGPSIGYFLPAGLLDAHDLATGSKLSEADAADLKKSEIATAAAAQFASMVNTDPLVHFLAFGQKLLFQPLGFDAERFSSHNNKKW
jgi:hypothetical protein